MLTISKVKVYPYKKRQKDGIIGIGQVKFDGGLLLTGLELVERHNKRFIVYPKNPQNNHDLCYCQPTNSVLNETIAKALFDEYDSIKNVETTTSQTYFNFNDLKNKMDMMRQQENKADGNVYVGLDEKSSEFIDMATQDLMKNLEEKIGIMKALNEHPSNGPDTVSESLEVEGET